MLRTSTISGYVLGSNGSPVPGRITVTLTTAFVSLDDYKIVPGISYYDSGTNGFFTFQLVPNQHTKTTYVITHDPSPSDNTPLRFKSGVSTKSVKVPDYDISLEDLLR